MDAISQENVSKLSQELRATHPADEPILLTSRKRAPADARPMRLTSPPAASVPSPPPEAEQPIMLQPKAAPAPGAAAGPEDAAKSVPRNGNRYPLKVEVDFQSEHHFYTGFLENISAGGLFIATHVPRPVGEAIEIAFTVPGLDRSCVAQCRVRWIREATSATADMPPGMGCQFAGLDADAAAAIELFLSHREPIFYDD